MKPIILLLFFLFLPFFAQSQAYSFETVDYKNSDLSWRIDKTPGIMTISKELITIDLGQFLDIFDIQSSQRFIRQNDIIFLCLNSEDDKVNIRFTNWSDDGKYVEAFFYSAIKNEKYIRYCLIKL